MKKKKLKELCNLKRSIKDDLGPSDITKILDLSLRVDFTNIFSQLFCANEMKSSVWQMAHNFGKTQQIFGKIHHNFKVKECGWNWTANFLPNVARWRLFAWQTKFGEINPRCQFHQHFMRAFFIQKFIQSQNVTRKKAFVSKFCTFNVDEIDHRS